MWTEITQLVSGRALRDSFYDEGTRNLKAVCWTMLVARFMAQFVSFQDEAILLFNKSNEQFLKLRLYTKDKEKSYFKMAEALNLISRREFSKAMESIKAAQAILDKGINHPQRAVEVKMRMVSWIRDELPDFTEEGL